MQEHLILGGDRYAGIVTSSDQLARRYIRNTTRPVGGLSEAQKMNKLLWALAEEFSHN